MPPRKLANKSRSIGQRKPRTPAKTPAKPPKSSGNSSPAKSSNGNNSAITPSDKNAITPSADISVPGLLHFSVEDIPGMLPEFDHNAYKVSDPLNPPENLPQVSQRDFNKHEATYQGAIRALKLAGLSFDLAKENFTTLRKKVSAFGAGLKLSTEIEKAKSDFLDYLTQVETTKQKNIALGVAQHKTTTDNSKASYDILTMDEKLEQSRIASELAKSQTQEKLSALEEFQNQLGQAA